MCSGSRLFHAVWEWGGQAEMLDKADSWFSNFCKWAWVFKFSYSREISKSVTSILKVKSTDYIYGDWVFTLTERHAQICGIICPMLSHHKLELFEVNICCYLAVQYCVLFLKRVVIEKQVYI